MGKTRRANPVEKFMNDFNKPRQHRDRKNDYIRREKHVARSAMRGY